MTGKIVKGIAGFYYVKVVGSAIYECRAKGIFRKEGIKPLVGDDVEIELTHEKDMEANIVHILPRKNELRRPQIANADQVLLIFALEDPKPGAGVLDRFLIQMERQDLPVIICFNKNDLADAAAADEWTGIYKDAGYETFAFSVKNGIGMDAVKKALDRKTTVIAGPSGVGKSSFINYLVPSAEREEPPPGTANFSRPGTKHTSAILRDLLHSSLRRWKKKICASCFRNSFPMRENADSTAASMWTNRAAALRKPSRKAK